MTRHGSSEGTRGDDQAERGQGARVPTDLDQQRQLDGGQDDEEQEEENDYGPSAFTASRQRTRLPARAPWSAA